MTMIDPVDRLYVSSVAVQGERDFPTIFSRLEGLGLKHVELSAPHPHMETDTLIALLQEWRGRGFSFLPHNYFPPPSEDFVLNAGSADPAVAAQSFDMISKAVRVGSAVNAPFHAYHAGYLYDAGVGDDGMFRFFRDTFIGDEKTLAIAVDTVRKAAGLLAEAPLPCGVLIENLFPTEKGWRHSLACTPDDLVEFFDAAADDRVGMLLDLAHLKVTCTYCDLDPDKALDQILEKLGDKVRALHLSDNDGTRDSHLPIDPKGWIAQATARALQLKGQEGKGLYATLESRRLPDDVLVQQMDFLLETMAAA